MTLTVLAGMKIKPSLPSHASWSKIERADSGSSFEDDVASIKATPPTPTVDRNQATCIDITMKRKPHYIYHFEVVYFAIEDCLYKLPKRNLQFSTFFSGMFGQPRETEAKNISPVSETREQGGIVLQTNAEELLPFGIEGEGRSDEHPIVLEGIEREAFDYLLRVLYPKHVNESMNFNLHQWCMVLELAHMWGFDDVRKLAIKSISEQKIDCIERVRLANKYEVTEWYEDACVELAKREEPVSLEEAEILGLEFWVKLARVREERFSKGTTARGQDDGSACCKRVGNPLTNRPVGDDELRKIICNVFCLPTAGTETAAAESPLPVLARNSVSM